MKNVSAVLLIAGAFLLYGCAGVDWINQASIEKKIKVERDDIKKVTRFIGPSCSSCAKERIPFDEVLLSATKSRNGVLSYSFEVTAQNTNWMYLDTAYDSEGRKLDVLAKDSMVLSCSSIACTNLEFLRIYAPHEYLTENQDAGITFEVSGKMGKKVYTIPGTYIKAFLSAAK